MLSTLNYRVILRKEPEGGYTVNVPSLPGCITYGDNVEEAIEMAKEAISLYIKSLKDHGDEIPNDDDTLEYNLMVKDNIDVENIRKYPNEDHGRYN